MGARHIKILEVYSESEPDIMGLTEVELKVQYEDNGETETIKERFMIDTWQYIKKAGQYRI